MRTHIFPGARIYGAPHLIYGARQIWRAPDHICAHQKIYAHASIFWCACIWRAPSNMWRAPDNIWRAPKHICAHPRIYTHASIFWCAYIWRAPSNIWRAPDNIWRAPDHRCARIYVLHLFSGARMYGARHLIYGARQIIYGARQIIYARTQNRCARIYFQVRVNMERAI